MSVALNRFIRSCPPTSLALPFLYQEDTHKPSLRRSCSKMIPGSLRLSPHDDAANIQVLPYDVNCAPIRNDAEMLPIAWFRAQERTTVPAINDKFEDDAAGIPAEALQVDSHVGQFFKFSLVRTTRYYMSTGH